MWLVELDTVVGMPKGTSKILVDQTSLSLTRITHKTAGVEKHKEKSEQVPVQGRASSQL